MNPRLFDLLITQIWQIAALAIVVALSVRLVAKHRPHLAHALWMLVLIKCVTPPLWGHSLGVFSQLQATFGHRESVVSPIEPQLKANPINAPVIELLAANTDPTAAVDRLPKFDEPEKSDFDSQSLSEPVAFDDNKAVEGARTPSAIAAATISSSTPGVDDIDFRNVLIFLVCTGAIITLSVMILRCLGCLRLIHRHRTTEFDDSLNRRILQLSKQLRVRRAPQIIVSDVLFGPAVLGLLRHTIVLPRCFFEPLTLGERSDVSRPIHQRSPPWNKQTSEDSRPAARRCVTIAGKEGLQFLDPILAHELLHIRRGDLRTGTLQVIAQCLWWFHPAVWFANRWLSREAERCCDEQVIAELGCTPGHYARSLLSVIESKHRLQPIPVFPGMRPVEITAQRMERIMSLKNGLNKRTPIWCWLMITALAFVVLPGAVAQRGNAEYAPAAATPGEDPESEHTIEDATHVREHKAQVTETTFEGNSFWSAGDLRKNLISKTAFLIFGAIYNPDTLPADIEALKRHYQSVGFFDVEITGKPLFSRDLSKVNLHFTVTEGQRYRVREIRYQGNNLIASSKFRDGNLLNPGDHYSAAFLAEDVQRMRDRYARAGHSSPAINPVLEFNEETGIIVLVFEIDEAKNDPAYLFVVSTRKHGKPKAGADLVGENLYASNLNRSDIVKGLIQIPEHPLPDRIRDSADPLVKPVWEFRESVRSRLLSTDLYSPWQIMNGLHGLRQDFLLKRDGNVVNGLEWIQSGPMFEGEPWFQKTVHGGQAHPYTKPYAFQGHINQFAATLAMCDVPPDAQFGTPDGPITMADLVKHAQMTANDKEEVCWTLQLLCKYLPPDAEWINSKGEKWSIERLIKTTISKATPYDSPDGGTFGLFALAVARNEYLRTGKPLAGVWLDADKLIQKHIQLVHDQQHSNGTLSSNFFRGREEETDFDKRLASSSALLQFLMIAVSHEQLREDWVRQAVAATVKDLNDNRQAFVSCSPLFSATNALSIFLDRVALPAVVSDKPESEDDSPATRFVLCAYPVADLVANRKAVITTASKSSDANDPAQQPVNAAESAEKSGDRVGANSESTLPETKSISLNVKADFAPLTELIKATVQPDSWTSEGRGLIAVEEKSQTLVIKQTQTAHDEIATLLSHLRNDQDANVRIQCRIVRLTNDSQIAWLDKQCSLHPLSPGSQWALLPQQRSEAFAQALSDSKPEGFFVPTLMTISGQAATIATGPSVAAETALTGIRLEITPHLLPKSNVMRLQHSFSIGALHDAMPDPNESLIGSGQTLVLLVNAPEENEATAEQSHYLLMLTPEHLPLKEESEKVVSPQPDDGAHGTR